MRIEIKGMEEVKNVFIGLQKELPTVMAKSLTFTADKVQRGLVGIMEHTFDRPTPYTLNSLKRTVATVNKQSSSVYFKDELSRTGGGSLPSEYLTPQIHGGSRIQKRFELALQHKGVLPRGWFAVPGDFAKIDQYGNISRGQIQELLSYFAAAEMTAGYTANMTAKKKARLKRGTKKKQGFVYFAIPPGQQKAPGIYKRLSSAWSAPAFSILIFVKSVKYKPRFDFYGDGQEIADREWRPIFDQALDSALRKLET